LDLLRTSIQRRPRIFFKGIFAQGEGYVSGYWQLPYTVPKGNYACFARLYDRTDKGTSGQLEFNLKWSPEINGWEIDIGVVEYRTADLRYTDPKTGPLENPGFMEFHDTLTTHWEAAPYSKYDAEAQFYFPYVPDDVLRAWFKLFEIDYTPPDKLVVKLHVDGDQMKGKVYTDYFVGTVTPTVPPAEAPPAAPPEEEVPPPEEAPPPEEVPPPEEERWTPGFLLRRLRRRRILEETTQESPIPLRK